MVIGTANTDCTFFYDDNNNISKKRNTNGKSLYIITSCTHVV